MSDIEYTTDQGFWTGPDPEKIRQRVEAAGPSADDWARFVRLRAELFHEIAKSLAEDGHCKSYEGAFVVNLPNYFEERAANDSFGWLSGGAWTIELHCYLIGPQRHYRWEGKSFAEALHKAEVDLRAWFAGEYSIRNDERL